MLALPARHRAGRGRRARRAREVPEPADAPAGRGVHDHRHVRRSRVPWLRRPARRRSAGSRPCVAILAYLAMLVAVLVLLFDDVVALIGAWAAFVAAVIAGVLLGDPDATSCASSPRCVAVAMVVLAALILLRNQTVLRPRDRRGRSPTFATVMARYALATDPKTIARSFHRRGCGARAAPTGAADEPEVGRREGREVQPGRGVAAAGHRAGRARSGRRSRGAGARRGRAGCRRDRHGRRRRVAGAGLHDRDRARPAVRLRPGGHPQPPRARPRRRP